jgi:hypothetical protein
MREKIAKVLERAAKALRREAAPENTRREVPELLPLTPGFVPEQHGVYFDAIEAALGDPEVKNIALTGSYGVGKSSILSEVTKEHESKVISVSLSTLGFDDRADEPGAGPALSKTNQIQKEIVKQLLYSQDPVAMPGSRYRRMTRFRAWRQVGLSALVAVPVAVIFALTGWSEKLAVAAMLPKELHPLMYAFVLVAAGVLSFFVMMALHNRVRISQLSAGSASISLSNDSGTYFDQYLDEIVYFFEVLHRDIVIFEDIDRFDDPHIFETLRSLNTLLNSAKQLGGRDIKFIYAIKDSIFDELGERAAQEEISEDEGEPLESAAKARIDAAGAQLARANRTKFFSLVIPVVPFITHRSARDLLDQTLHGLDHDIKPELIDLAAQHVADMRLIKNIRNEFVIFKNRVIDAGTLDLDQNSLFAMVLYKSTHLSDFELIRLGQSKLDDLYRDRAELVGVNIRRLIVEIGERRTALGSLNPAAGKGKRLGDRLITYLERFARLNGYTIVSRIGNGADQSDEQLRSDRFWREFAASETDFTFTHRRPGWGDTTVTLPRKDVAAIVGDRLDSDEWIARERKRLTDEIASANADRQFLARADMSDLVGRPEFTIMRNGKAVSYEDLVRARMQSELAVQLISNGYIDRNFTLYTSTFHSDRVSANAMNFILKNIETGLVDNYFPLAAVEAAAVLREKGLGILRERVAYNVDLVDYLLDTDRDGAVVVALQLTAFGDAERDFLAAYLETGRHSDVLVELLAPRWPHVLVYLVSEVIVDDEPRVALAGTALQHLAEDVTYDLGDDVVREYLEANYRRLDVFTREGVASGEGNSLGELLERAVVRLEALDVLSPEALDAAIGAGSYVVTRSNLEAALKGDASELALDDIARSNDDVYQRLLTDLGAYLACLVEGEYSIRDPKKFRRVIEDVLEKDVSQIDSVVERAEPGCVVDDLSEVAEAAWEALVAHGRVRLSVANLNSYIAEIGMDEELANMLTTAGAVVLTDGDDEDQKEELAVDLLNARELLPSAELRAALAGSLGLDHWLDPPKVPVEMGKLVGWLIEKNVLGDDAEAFTALEVSDVEGRAFAISKSGAFTDFMTPTEIPPAQVGQLIDNAAVPRAVKDRIASQFAVFTAGASRSALAAVAQYAAQHGQALNYADVARLATERVASDLVLRLLAPLLNDLLLEQLRPVLIALGGEYSKLTGANGKRAKLHVTDADRALATRVDRLGVVSSVSEDARWIYVNMKRR